jgi:hypothetical protein
MKSTIFKGWVFHAQIRHAPQRVGHNNLGQSGLYRRKTRP